jgi:hypothetical protein
MNRSLHNWPANKPNKISVIIKGGKANQVLTNTMKSPLNASSSPLPAPRDMDNADQLSHLYSHVATLNGQYRFPILLMLTENAKPFRTSNGDDGATINHPITCWLY